METRFLELLPLNSNALFDKDLWVILEIKKGDFLK